MKIDEMTLDQIRDYIAECKGYTKHLSHWHAPGDDGFSHVPLPHPVPDTVEAAKESLPDGWVSKVLSVSVVGIFTYRECLRDTITDTLVFGHGISKKHARFRAAAKAWHYEKMAPKTYATIDLSGETPEDEEAIRNAKDSECVPVSKPYLIPYIWHIKVASDGTGIVGNTASVAPVSQTWTLPTDTPDGEVYIQPGDWNIWNEFTGQDNTSGIKWRPTDVPKAQEVAEPSYRISKGDRDLILRYLKVLSEMSYADARLLNLRIRLLQAPEAAK